MPIDAVSEDGGTPLFRGFRLSAKLAGATAHWGTRSFVRLGQAGLTGSDTAIRYPGSRPRCSFMASDPFMRDGDAVRF